MTFPILNRELGVLAFNERVLAQAEDPSIPLLERLRFVCITSSNLDEFSEIRMSGLQEQMREAIDGVTPDGMSLQHAYTVISERAQKLVARQYALFNDELLPALNAEGIVFYSESDWDEKQSAWAHEFFKTELLPVLTPIGLDPAHPFPKVLNKSLNFAVKLSGKDAFGREPELAIVQAPRALPRLVRMPDELSRHPYGFVLLSSFMQCFVGELFPGLSIGGCYQFRVTRNSDLFVDEDEVTDLRLALQGELPTRQLGNAVRLEVAEDTPASLVLRLLKQNGLQQADCYRVNGSVNLVRLMPLPDLVDRPDLKFAPHTPVLPKSFFTGSSVFDVIDQGDVLLHHPYESFQPVLELLQQAAIDPDVLAIKQTIYRTGNESALMLALMQAAKNGKEVTVVLELMARFDEETNIGWAAKLEAVGAHVVYGVFGYKTHAKMLLIVRRKRHAKHTKLKRYVHLGTGNYHSRTARLYTDFGLMTSDDKMCEDVHNVFQQLTGFGKQVPLKRLWQSPFTLHANILKAIEKEVDAVKAGRQGYIIAKMNALLEPTVIAALYGASQAGVRIQLIIRGVCALHAGVPGLSENITVRSVIGRFLEHHRVFYFYADGDEHVILSSADWMDRNLFRRIETAFPILDSKLKRRVIEESLLIHLQDNASAWDMKPDGTYKKVTPGDAEPMISQIDLLARF
ncbi:polyphosphate kinase 1 [Glaciimonas immobilis]|uniref:Polyphosphate kinase n=1 Tax=Glaciimonas immobilis TaxID=728004 RepID=A0A840RU42_9BURK|nr:polyphosphate kinase 1 [Glaciimonas immobilis]KAF3998422.1 polyphosphate kinase 1 [Glaciimonas immobilis]MBB5202087.1 polyphosphate kinase [Glaciimonas immobilis]